MIEPPRLFTHDRLVFDIREIESLATLIIDLALPVDRALCESFERLVELAGTRDFLPSFSKLQDLLYGIKTKQTAQLEYGWIVPQSSLQELSDWSYKKSNPIIETPQSGHGGLVGNSIIELSQQITCSVTVNADVESVEYKNPNSTTMISDGRAVSPFQQNESRNSMEFLKLEKQSHSPSLCQTDVDAIFKKRIKSDFKVKKPETNPIVSQKQRHAIYHRKHRNRNTK
jgi:hypothetical protein